MRRVHVLAWVVVGVMQFQPQAFGALGDQLITLRSTDAAFGDNLGQSVDIDGNLAVVGASGDVPAGSAYVFDIDTGRQLLKLNANDSVDGGYFGSSVAIDDEIVVVGAPGNTFSGSPDSTGPGQAYVFDVTTGQQLFRLGAADAAEGDEFGWSVGISGETIIVGAPNKGDSGRTTGAAYLFDVTTGKQTSKLLAHDAAAGDNFGISVDIDEPIAIVGARWDDDWGEASGSAYLFDVTEGHLLHKLTSEDAAQGDRLGISVGISGDIAIAGAFADDDAGKSSGSAYLFDVTTGEQTFKLTADDAAQLDHFGWSVAISGDTAVVGSVTDQRLGLYSGSAYLFDVWSGTQLSKLTAGDGAEFDQFGRGIAIDENRLIVGAPQLAIGDVRAIDTFTGKAYVFDAAVPEPSCFVLCLLGFVSLIQTGRWTCRYAGRSDQL